jgi:two-component system sensor histidine kinase UhpB
VAFWRGRHPEIRFEVSIPPEETPMAGAVRETLYRVVQEGLSNAIRHGRPSRVTIRIRAEGEWVEARVSDDGARAAAPGPEGFGLTGMRQRLAAVGGALEVRRGAGWTLIARAPAAAGVGDLMVAAS